MSEINIDEIVNYKQEYEKIVHKFKVQGDRLTGLCPFHDDKKESFSVDLKTGKYNCFACGESGNFINFKANILGISTKDAYKEILHEHGIEEDVKMPFTVDEYSELKKLPKDWLIETFNITNGKDRDGTSFIKMPYFNKNHDQVVFRKRYPPNAAVRFRWSNGSAGKLLMYGEWRLEKIKNQGYCILVEGESDTQSLWHLGLPALGVPGASVFKPEWVEKLKDLKLYLHIEPDKGGQTFLTQMTKKLHDGGFEGEVFRFTCDNHQVKDPSELYLKLGKDEAKEKIIGLIKSAEKIDLENLQESLPEAIEGAPINLMQPAGWIYDNRGIHKIDEKTRVPECICRTPIILTQRLKSIETGEEKIEVAFKRDNAWHTAIFNRSVIFQSKSITALADLGCTITSENAKHVVRFLEALEKENFELLKLTDSTSSFGWQTKNRFLPGHAPDLAIDIDPSLQNWANAYSKNGTLAEWLEQMKPHRKRYKFRFILSAAFTAPLLKIIKQRIFFVYNWGGSRGGKTAALKAALSVWGDPEKLMANFNATQVALERMAAFYCDLPLGIDERQLAGSKQENLEKLVYMLSSGTGRARGSKTGGVQALSTWRTVVLSTGEEPITKSNSQTGVNTRILEIVGGPFDDEAEASRMHQQAALNCGWAGPEFVGYIKNIDERSIIDRYNEIYDEIVSIAAQSNKAHIASIAAVTLADIIVSELFYKTDSSRAKENALKMAALIIKDLRDNETPDVNESAVQFIADWITMNVENFSYYENAHNPYKQFYGKIEGEIVSVLITPLREALEKAGFSYRKTLKYMADEGIIESSSQGGVKVYSTIKSFGGAKSRVIVINRAMI